MSCWGVELGTSLTTTRPPNPPSVNRLEQVPNCVKSFLTCLLSLRGEAKVKHCRVQKEDNIYRLGSTMEFDSLVELVNHFRKKPLYRKIKLRYPVTPELVERFSKVSEYTGLLKS